MINAVTQREGGGVRQSVTLHYGIRGWQRGIGVKKCSDLRNTIYEWSLRVETWNEPKPG